MRPALEVAPGWARKAVEERLTRMLVGGGAEP